MNALLLTPTPTSADERALLAFALQRAGLHVDSSDELAQALAAWSAQPAELIVAVLDGAHALAQVRQLRAQTIVPLLVLLDPDLGIAARAPAGGGGG